MTNSFKFEKTFPVNTYDCDFEGRWKPTAFFQVMSESAANHADLLGVGYKAMLEAGYFWVLSRFKVRFLKYPHMGDLVHLKTWPKTIQQKLFYVRDFELFDQTDEPVALGSSAWLVLDANARRLVPPASLPGLTLPANPETFALDEPLEKLKIDDGGEVKVGQKASYSAIDLVGHVNNTRYIDLICDSVDFTHYQTREFDSLQINFDKEVRHGEEVEVRETLLQEDPMKLGFVGNNLSQQTRAFEAVVQLRPKTG